MEAEQFPTAPLTTKQLMVKVLQRFYGMLNDVMDYLEEVDPDVEWAGLSRRKVMADLGHHEQLLYEKRREATQATLCAFSTESLPEAAASNEPHTSEELPTNDEPQPSTPTGGFTCTNVPSP